MIQTVNRVVKLEMVSLTVTKHNQIIHFHKYIHVNVYIHRYMFVSIYMYVHVYMNYMSVYVILKCKLWKLLSICKYYDISDF